MTRKRFAFAVLSLFLLPFVVVPVGAGTPRFLRMPNIHGDQVVFTCEGDLWIGSIQNRSARRITTHPGLERAALFSPDGRYLAFTAQYDGATEIYVMSVEGGLPTRLTYDGRVRTVGWTPDGKYVLYRSSRNNVANGWANRLWRVPASGGPAEAFSIPRVEFAALNADGRRLAFVPVSGEWMHWARYRGGMADDIWLTDLDSRTFRKLTDFKGVDTSPFWIGEKIYFVSERDGLANLYSLDPVTGSVGTETSYGDYGVRYPSSDGERAVYEHGSGLGLFDPRSGKTEDLDFAFTSDRIHARPHRVPALASMSRPAVGPAGKRILFESRGQIVSVPADSGNARVLAPSPGSRSQYPAWSADGKWVAFVSDRSGEEQIWVTAADGSGQPRQITRDHQGPLGKIVWSPDGKLLAVGDREARILLVDVASGETTLVDQADRAGAYDTINDSYRFSPDGKWLVFWRMAPNWNRVIVLYDVVGKRNTVVSSPEMTSYAPAFDPAGKVLYFLSDRTFIPLFSDANRSYAYDKVTNVSIVPLGSDVSSPFLLTVQEEGIEKKATSPADSAKSGGDKLPKMKVDLEAIGSRIESVPVPADRYARVEAVEGRLLLMSLVDFPIDTDPNPDATRMQLRAFDLKKKDVKVLVGRLSDFEVSANHTKLLIRKGKGLTVVDASTGPVGDDAKPVPLDGVTLQVDPEAEWRQMFAEAWRIARDFFYDPNLHGVDWLSVRHKYEELVPGISDRSDLNEIIGDMLAELNAGHAYIGGGDVPAAPTIPMGYLGADMELARGPGGEAAYRVGKIYPGDGFDYGARSPLLTAGVNVRTGDYILAVNGQPVRADQDIQALLVGTAGQITSLTVNARPASDGARVVYVRPMAREGWTRYYDWVESRGDYVRTHGGENLGYVHVPDMSADGLRAFTKHYYANLDKDGMIYDVRNNGGGLISALLLLHMSQKPYAWFKPRYGVSWTRQDWGFQGYAAALCNEYSWSNAEEFCDGFQRLKLGPVIGVPSGGGEVGSGNGYDLLDGGQVFVPNYGEWAPGDGWVIEGSGVEPDIVVEADPAAVIAGRDPQLDRAIAELKARLEREPIVRPVPPPFPKKAAGPGGGR
jgi:tricorn protease